jgi:Rps23 Pro-64 3,4-dihydroxylase Tpa1-like proline 4-hydroxylase
VTAILYLNPIDWGKDSEHQDGGNLLCYIDAAKGDTTGNTSSRIDSICPAGGTLVLFDSRYLLHEVCPSTSVRDRYALSIWIYGDETEYSGRGSQTDHY